MVSLLTPSVNPQSQSTIVILGIGGTIAGTAARATDAVGYTAAQLGVAQLVAAVPALAPVPIECEQVAQLDSKEFDAVTLARDASVRGVSVVIAGRAWAGAEVRKHHTYRIDAFDADDAGPLALIEDGQVRVLRAQPAGGDAIGLDAIARDAAAWPRVEAVLNHAGADGALVDALLAQGGVHGLVVAGTGNGTLSVALKAALRRAAHAGVRVLRASRCAAGPVQGGDSVELPGAGALTAVQARVELLLQLLSAASPHAVSQ